LAVLPCRSSPQGPRIAALARPVQTASAHTPRRRPKLPYGVAPKPQHIMDRARLSSLPLEGAAPPDSVLCSIRASTLGPRAAQSRRAWALASACTLILGCRGALGIDELDLSSGDESSGSGGASAGTGAGAGSRGTSDEGMAGRAGSKATAGQAGVGGSGVGGSGAGGSGAGGPSGTTPPPKTCERACVDDAPTSWMGKYFDAYAACACSDGGLPSCASVCGTCSLDATSVSGASNECLACIGQKAVSADCADVGHCDKHCGKLRECLAECSE
jgi:hypothetical protein